MATSEPDVWGRPITMDMVQQRYAEVKQYLEKAIVDLDMSCDEWKEALPNMVSEYGAYEQLLKGIKDVQDTIVFINHISELDFGGE